MVRAGDIQQTADIQILNPDHVICTLDEGAEIRIDGQPVRDFTDLKTRVALHPGKRMTFTVEPMINLGRPDVALLQDGWTAVTRDGSISAHFEHTVAVTRGGVAKREAGVGSLNLCR